MFIVFAQVLLGLFLTGLGIYLGYYYLTIVDAGANIFIAIVAFVLSALGVYFLFQAGRSDATVVTKAKVSGDKIDKVKTLQKNNDLVKTYKKTMDARDRLKLLQMQGEEANRS